MSVTRPVLQRGSASALVGLAQWTGGDLDGASARYTDAIESLTAAGHISDVLGCSIALADMRLVQGRLGDAERVFETALELARTHHVVRGTADMHAGLSEVLIERDDLAGARRHLDTCSQLGEQACAVGNKGVGVSDAGLRREAAQQGLAAGALIVGRNRLQQVEAERVDGLELDVAGVIAHHQQEGRLRGRLVGLEVGTDQLHRKGVGQWPGQR